MRIWTTGLLLASAALAAPAVAQDHQHWQGGAPQGAQPGAGGWHGGAPGGGNGARPMPDGGAARGTQPGQPGQPRQYGQRPQPGQSPAVHVGGWDGRPGGGPGRGFEGRPGMVGSAPRGPDGGARGFDGRPDRGAQGGPEPRHVEVRPQGDVNVWRDGRDRRDGRFDGRPGGQRFAGDRDGRFAGGGGWAGGPGNPRGQGYRPDNRDWNRGWRDDRRYDWQGWRDSHRSAYRLGRYYAPSGYGYGYRRFGIGAALAPAFFAEGYWIGDPAYYRLPPAYGPYRWVRYYNDALLVDIRSGVVVDSIPDFFW